MRSVLPSMIRAFLLYGGASLLTALAVYGFLDLSGRNRRRDVEPGGSTAPSYWRARALR